MLNPYQKRLMAEGFLLRLQEAEDKVALVMELMDESAAQVSITPPLHMSKETWRSLSTGQSIIPIIGSQGKPIDLNKSPYECNSNVENIND